MQHFIELEFPIKRIRQKKALSDKLSTLNIDPYFQRIMTRIRIFDENVNEMIVTEGILDTGAPFSLIPKNLLSPFMNINGIDHTIHGIVDSPECNLVSTLTSLTIELIDKNHSISPRLQILVALTEQDEIPILLGLKGLFDREDIQFSGDKNMFKLKFQS